MTLSIIYSVVDINLRKVISKQILRACINLRIKKSNFSRTLNFKHLKDKIHASRYYTCQEVIDAAVEVADVDNKGHFTHEPRAVTMKL